MTNSQRFIDSYNRCDRALHSRFGFKPSMTFSDAVRRAATMNAVVRKFEDDLIDYGRLRNAIVHKSDSTMTIAEPHSDVTERFERIAEILSEPPLASTIAHGAITVDAKTPLTDAVRLMCSRGYSNLPVTDRGDIIGMLTNKSIVGYVGKNVTALDDAFDGATVADALEGSGEYFAVMPDCAVDEILGAFEKNRKLTMVILTKDGMSSGKIVGVITVGDVVTIAKMLDTY